MTRICLVDYETPAPSDFLFPQMFLLTYLRCLPALVLNILRASGLRVRILRGRSIDHPIVVFERTPVRSASLQHSLSLSVSVESLWLYAAAADPRPAGYMAGEDRRPKS